MATRCQIGFYETDTQPVDKPSVIIYKHWDGYPSVYDDQKKTAHPNQGMIPLLLPFLKDFQDARGIDDLEYCAAWMLHYMIDIQIKRNLKHSADKNSKKFGGRDFVSYGVCARDHVFHDDIDWFYRITPTNLFVHFHRWKQPPARWPVTVVIDLTKNAGKVAPRILKQAQEIPEGSFRARGIKDA